MNTLLVYSNLSVLILHICLNVHLSTQNSHKFTLEYGNPSELLLRRFKKQSVNDNGVTNEKIEIRQPAECGINSRSQRYINLSNDLTPIIDWPWMAGLLLKNHYEHFCGGVLLNRNYVLTAAHCFDRYSVDDVLIRLGEYDFTISNETEYIDFAPTQIIKHGDYDSATQHHDIALIKFERPIQYTNYIRPICLPPPSLRIKANQTAIVAGWGAIFYGGITSPTLLEVAVPIWNLKTCISKYVQPIFKTNICASGYAGGKDSCIGDSGGPLIIQQSDGRWISIGIVSWGIGCGDKEQPGVYTSVEAYMRWIETHTRDAQI
ncbi:hypothetical protein PGB90_006807 [Kerria lacca]